jgi:beta-galactosidase
MKRAPIVFCLAASLASGQSLMSGRFGPIEEVFPVAVWYGGGKARAPMLEPDAPAKREIWRKDLRQIRALGFNAIRCWVDWASAEPEEERDRFDTLDVLLGLAEEEGLKVMVQVYMDSAPDWVGRKYPDAHYVAINGYVMKPEAAPGYCRDHPGVHQAELAFFTRLAERAAKSSVFAGWDLWSEPHVINWATATFLTNPEFCFCPHTTARYQRWLKDKYGSLDALNQAWYRRFSSWEQIEPNRLSTILSYTDYLDWRQFLQEKLRDDLKDRTGAVKRAAPKAIATSHSAISSIFTSPTAWDGSPDDFLMAPAVDFYGTSLYPKHSRPVGYDAPWRGALLDAARSSGYAGGGNGFYVGELQGGFGTVALNVSATVTPQDLRMWAWSAISRGAKGINFYAWYPMNSGYESGGYGLIQLDGTITERARVAGRIARVVDRHQKLLLAARPPVAEVAIVYNPLSYMVGGRQRVATTGPQSEVAGIERNSMLGVYRALFPTNVAVDFVHVRELEAAKLRQYRLLFMPYPLMLPESAGPPLKEYVRQGGALVTEARAGWTNDRGYASEVIPGLGLHEVLGCRETSVQTVPGLRPAMTWTDGTDLLPQGTKIVGRLYEEVLEPLGPQARVVARWTDGQPAAVLSTYGQGKTLAFGSYLGVVYEQTQDEVLGRLFRNLLPWAGVSQPVTAAEGQIEARMLESGDERLLFVFHHGDVPAIARLRLNPEAPYHAEDFESGARLPFPLEKKMEPQGVWIVRLKR